MTPEDDTDKLTRDVGKQTSNQPAKYPRIAEIQRHRDGCPQSHKRSCRLSLFERERF